MERVQGVIHVDIFDFIKEESWLWVWIVYRKTLLSVNK